MFRYMVIIIYEVPTDFSNFSFVIFLYRNFYFCSEIYIFVLGKILLYCCIHEWRIWSHNRWICLFWNLCFLLRDWYFFSLELLFGVLRTGDTFPYWSLYFCTEINISVLGYILLYWCIFYCTGKYTRTANGYVCVLRYRMQ